MTVVVAMRPNGYPVLVGDILVSSTIAGSSAVHLPTVGTVLPREGPFHMAGARQKIAIVSRTMAVGWAGPVYAARKVVKDLRELASREEIDLDRVKRYLREMPEWLHQAGLSLVGHVIHGDLVSSFGYNSWTVESDVFGEMHIAGTGSYQITRMADQVADASLFDDFNQFEQGVAKGIMLAGALINEELVSRSTLETHFGGAYEICTYQKDAFAKIEDVTYLWWLLYAEKEPGQFRFPKRPRRILRPMYSGDVMAVYTLHPGEGGQSPDDWCGAVHAVAPIGSMTEVQLPDRSLPDFNSPFMCNMVAYVDEDDHVDLLNQLYLSTSGMNPIRITKDEERVTVAIHQRFLNDLGNAVLARKKST